MSGITEVNSLPPHYRCPNCKHTEFNVGSEYGCGADMPDKKCPECGAMLKKEGFVISREELLLNIGSIKYESSLKSIDVIMGRIRQKIGDDPKKPRFILSVRGVGYKFVNA